MLSLILVLRVLLFGRGLAHYGGAFEGCQSLEEVIILGEEIYIDETFRQCDNVVLKCYAWNEDVQAFGERYGIPVEIMANPTGEHNGLQYEIIRDEVVITGYTGTESGVAIPLALEGKVVTTIGEGAFKDNVTLKHIGLHQNIKTIEKECFSGCINLEEVFDDHYVSEIGAYAFEGCEKLISFDLSDDIKEIEPYTFSGCDLQSVDIPQGVITIGSRAFFSNPSLENVYVPSSVLSIGFEAFGACIGLRTAYVPVGEGDIPNINVFKRSNNVSALHYKTISRLSNLLPREIKEAVEDKSVIVIKRQKREKTLTV